MVLAGSDFHKPRQQWSFRVCDGHAEVHIWQDSDTKARLEFYFSNPSIQDYGFGGGSALNSNFIPTPGQNNDTEYMGRGWAVQSPTRK